jgi:iron-sulfur cluster assembly accessory protein
MRCTGWEVRTDMINVSDRAASELKRLIEEQGQDEVAVRVFVTGSCGCGAAHYGMGLDTDFTEEEHVFDAAGLRLVADNDALPYLEGAEIDYRDSLMGRGFTIKNPNAGGGCGCGH